MNEQRFPFETKFLKDNPTFSVADLSYDFKTDSYSDSYIDSCYQQDVINHSKALFHYISFDESAVQELARIHESVDVFVDQMQDVCKAFNAKGFNHSNTFAFGFVFKSFIFENEPSDKMWKRYHEGYVLRSPYLAAGLGSLLATKKYRTRNYNTLFNAFNIQSPEDVVDLKLLDGCLVLSTVTQVTNLGILIPTTKEYINYISNLE